MCAGARRNMPTQHSSAQITALSHVQAALSSACERPSTSVGHTCICHWLALHPASSRFQGRQHLHTHSQHRGRLLPCPTWPLQRGNRASACKRECHTSPSCESPLGL